MRTSAVIPRWASTLEGVCLRLMTHEMSTKGHSSHDRGRFVSSSFCRTPSIQTIIQIMNILNVFGLFVILLKCVAASGDTLEVAFKEAVDGRNSEWLKKNWWSWYKRKDLLDGVIAKSADATVWLIQTVGSAKKCVFAALFDKGEGGMIDDVLGKVEYSDDDLVILTGYRHELAVSPKRFFGVLDKIKDPKNQEAAVCGGVRSLFGAGRHDLVVPLVNAFGRRASNDMSLKEKAIQEAFYEGAKRGNQDIVKLYHGHPAITSDEYYYGLDASWNFGKSNQIFQFLLKQADQGDLDMAKKKYADKRQEQFRQAIDDALKPVPHAGSRIIPVEMVQRALAALAPIINASDEYGPGIIIKEYILGEKETTRKSESEEQEAGTENHTD